jgi:predicted N-acyltransferase
MREVVRQGIRIETLVGEAIPDRLFAAMFDFYLSTIQTQPYGRQYLNRRFFELLRDRFRHRLCFILARRGDRAIAGSLNVQKGDVLYGRYWGCTSEVRYLHFNVCYYATAEYCIREGLQRFEPGAGGDYKQLRGFDAQPTWSLHFVADPRLRAAVAAFLTREREEAERAIEWLRDRSALKRTEA